jgi:hypothetical protein
MDEDDSEDDLAAALGEFDDERDHEATEDEDDNDEIEPSVENSDAAIVDEVVAETNEEPDIPALSAAEENLGRFAVTKVSLLFVGLSITRRR